MKMLTLTEIMTISECYPDREHFARAVITAYAAKLREQEPVGFPYIMKWISDYSAHRETQPLYLHPAPMPEGVEK